MKRLGSESKLGQISGSGSKHKVFGSTTTLVAVIMYERVERTSVFLSRRDVEASFAEKQETGQYQPKRL